MSGVRNARTSTANDSAEEAKNDGSVLVSDLVKQGFVLEVTAKDPDSKDSDGKIIPGKVFDYYHHPCFVQNCTHEDRSTCGQWKKIPAADITRSVN